jgi:hypothetical protein
MRTPTEHGGLWLKPTVFTFTAAMKAAMDANHLSAALAIWEDAKRAGVPLDIRLRCTYMTVLLHAGRLKQVLEFYEEMVRRNELVPQHALVLAMRALARLNQESAALDIWRHKCLGMPENDSRGERKGNKRRAHEPSGLLPVLKFEGSSVLPTSLLVKEELLILYEEEGCT